MISVLVVGAGAGLLVYVIAIYPLLLGWLASRFAKPVTRETIHRPVSFLIAVHNGEAYLREKLNSILALDYPRELMETFVLSDGSTDHTDEIARSMQDRGVRLIALPRGGKPAALNAGIAAASGEFLILTDVRQTLAPDALSRLMERFADPEVGVVSGALVIRDLAGGRPAKASLYWRYEFWLRDQLSSLRSIFGASGAFYAIRKELAVPIPHHILLDDMYLPLAAFFKGYRLVVEPQARIFDYPASLNSEFHRKVRTLAGNYQILAAYPQLLGPRNPLLWHFVSYKFGRLLLPFALIAIFAGSWGLPSPLNLISFALQGLVYGLALIDRWIPESSFFKKASGPASTFVVLMAAGVAALSILFVPSDRLWKRSEMQKAVDG